MNGPKRLVERDGYQASLIAAARREEPDPHTEQRLLSALGVGAVTTAAVGAALATHATAKAAGAASQGGTLGAALIAKWFFVGVVGSGAVLGVGTVGHDMISTSRAPQPAVSAPAPPVEQRPAVSVVESLAPVTAASEEPPTAAPPPQASSPALTSSLPPAPSSAPAPEAASLLRAEVASIAAVREALARGDGQGAWQRLDAHDRAFPQAKLGPEASMLRLEALLAMGQHAEARRRARASLDANPTGPWAPRLREIAGDPPDDSSIKPSDPGHGNP
jgi:hypothetical protein